MVVVFGLFDGKGFLELMFRTSTLKIGANGKLRLINRNLSEQKNVNKNIFNF